MENLLSNPFWLGLAVGLLVALILWVRSLVGMRELNHNVRRLKEHLHTKLEIDAEENERRKKDMDRIKEERDNLRNMIQVMNQKPGRQELRQMQIYQKAIEIMFERSPGFAPAWQITVKEAEEEIKKAERGIIPFFKRMTSSSTQFSEKAARKQLEMDEGRD